MGLFKRKKQLKEFSKIMNDALSDAKDRSQTIGKTIFNRQIPDHADYGRCESRPIFTLGLSATESYLAQLCTKNGEKFTWSPPKSIRATVCGYEDIGEDVYTLYLNGKPYTELYFVLYVGQSKFPPAGMYFCGDDTDWELEREAYSKGVTVEQLKMFKKMVEEDKKEKQKERDAFQEKLSLKANELRNKYPSFSIDLEMQNPLFSFLAEIDFNLVTAYEYCHKEELNFKKIYEISSKAKFETKEFFLSLLCQIEKKERHIVDIANKQTTEDLRKEAKELNIELENLIEVRQMEREHILLKWNVREKELSILAEKAEKAQKLISNFDLELEWSNFIFRKIAQKFDILVAYELIHFNECYSYETPVKIPSIQNNDCDQLFCRKCGTKLIADSVFCYKCGEKVIVIE